MREKDSVKVPSAKVFMQRALELAKRGEGFVSPNPCVGAVIAKDGKIIGEGWHKKAGDNHAEIVAMKAAVKTVGNKRTLHGADLYVTLEPCCHYGKTSPCTLPIIESGIKRVFVGMKDPFEKVSGNGIKMLKKAGITVEVLPRKDSLAVKIRELNQPFLKFVKTGLPYLTIKAGVSLDGKIATASGESHWITREKSREDARMERGKCDAVVIGANTVKMDNPELRLAGKYARKEFFRIVIDGKLDLTPDYKVFKNKNVMVFCGRDADPVKRRKFEKAGIEVVPFGGGEIKILNLLEFLAKRGVRSVFVEGGGETNGAFYDAFLRDDKLLDRVIFYIAPMIIGGRNSIPVIGGLGAKKLSECGKFPIVRTEMLDGDLRYTAILNRY